MKLLCLGLERFFGCILLFGYHLLFVISLLYVRGVGPRWSSGLERQSMEVETQGEAVRYPVPRSDIRMGIMS